ncbi:hypothetical protein LCGC14_1994910 [marine sediment metagenome]|uniref:Uncharacterized protein n=1 Tax=marine sediment metagenome TaxID=412755 RepID=A0A0F9F579_9ZZZZ
MTSNLKTIKRLAKTYDVGVSTSTRGGRRVICLRGFLSAVEACSREVKGYWVEKTPSGFYLYSERANWTKTMSSKVERK